MGNLECCGERSEHQAKALLQNMPSQTSTAHVVTEDIIKFDKALKENDVAALVALLDSDSPFCVMGKLDEIMGHPWAEAPQSVAALAATQLAALASTDEALVKTAIVGQGAIAKLRKMLSLRTPTDRREAALVALTFLTLADDTQPSEGAEQLVAMQAFDDLVKNVALAPATTAQILATDLTSAPSRGKIPARLAAAQVCRNMYSLSVAQKHAFVRAGGVTALVGLLGDIGDDYDARLECLYLLDDLLAPPSTDELVGTVAEIPQLRRLLEANCRVDDEEVVSAAKNLCAMLYE